MANKLIIPKFEDIVKLIFGDLKFELMDVSFSTIGDVAYSRKMDGNIFSSVKVFNILNLDNSPIDGIVCDLEENFNFYSTLEKNLERINKDLNLQITINSTETFQNDNELPYTQLQFSVNENNFNKGKFGNIADSLVGIDKYGL